MPRRQVFPNTSTRFASTGLEPPTSHIPSTFTDGQPLPKIFVFDLDYTLWPFWVDTHVSSPLKPAHADPSQNTAMVDRYGELFSFSRDVPGILHAARQKGVLMGLASRTSAPDLAEKLLRNIVVPVPSSSSSTAEDGVEGDKPREKVSKAWEYFTYKEIYPGSKIKHFNRIQSSTAKKGGEEVAFGDMIFFDDEGRNREVETQLGVTFVLVRDGVTIAEIDRGVREWRRRKGITAKDTEAAEEDAVAEMEG